MTPLTPSMLWEATDAHVALVQRFRFASAEEAARWLADTLLHTYGVQVAAVDRLVISSYNLLAWLTRRVVKSLLESAGFDHLIRRIDVGRTLERVSPSALVGLAAMLFVFAEATIAALDQLHLSGLSATMTAAVTEVGAALPDIGLGLLILIVGHVAGRLARRWV